MELIQTILPDVVRRLGYYVYAYVNPLDGQIFYVGKGRGQRILSHLADRADTRKVTTLKQIRAAGKQPRLEILAHGLGSKERALQVEAAVIDALTLPFLTNQVRGWRSSRYGRTPIEELIALYRRRPVRIQESSILIRITELYRPQMTASELYDATRASWKVGEKRQPLSMSPAKQPGLAPRDASETCQKRSTRKLSRVRYFARLEMKRSSRKMTHCQFFRLVDTPRPQS